MAEKVASVRVGPAPQEQVDTGGVAALDGQTQRVDRQRGEDPRRLRQTDEDNVSQVS